MISWLCAVLGTALAIPQCARILKSGTTAGVSLLSWQLWGVIGLAWAMHGALSGSITMLIPNACSAVLARFIIGMVMRERRLRAARVIVWPLLVVGLAAGLRLVLGPIPFSLFMLFPQAVAVMGQGLDLVRCHSLLGVSGHYLRASVLMQSLWLAYGIAGNDVACTISSIMMIVLVSTNLTLYLLRRTDRLQAHPGFLLRPMPDVAPVA